MTPKITYLVLAAFCLLGSVHGMGSSMSKLIPGIKGQLEKCKNRPNRSKGERWACEDPKLEFPTVACLTADILLCGKAKDKGCVFYSFGTHAKDAQEYASGPLKKKATTFHHVLDNSYAEEVLLKDKYGMTTGKMTGAYPTNDNGLDRWMIYTSKVAQAFASVCKENAYLVVLHYQGEGPAGGPGIWQKPLPGSAANRPDNVWIEDEFPSLTNNDKIKKIFSVDKTDSWKLSIDWEAGGTKLKPRDIDHVQMPGRIDGLDAPGTSAPPQQSCGPETGTSAPPSETSGS